MWHYRLAAGTQDLIKEQFQLTFKIIKNRHSVVYYTNHLEYSELVLEAEIQLLFRLIKFVKEQIKKKYIYKYGRH